MRLFCMAGAGGIEPTLTVLETVVLPLYDAPIVFLDAGKRIKTAKEFQWVRASHEKHKNLVYFCQSKIPI